MLIILAVRLLFMLEYTDSYPSSENNVRSCSCAPLNVPCDFKTIHCCNSRKENIALGKEVRYRSLFEIERFSGMKINDMGCFAVNGNINPHYVRYEKGKQNANCYRSAEHDPKPYWKVDLVHYYRITEITIVVDSARKDLMNNVEVYVDNDLCYKFTQVNIDSRQMTHITCPKPLLGRFVKLTKSTPPARFQRKNILSFCEVQVWICNKGLYGQNCEKECSEGCNNCDYYSGVCASCAVGYYGMFCDELCKCPENKCNVDGSCLDTTTMPASQLVQGGPVLSPNVPGSQLKVSEGMSNIASESESNTIGIVIGVIVGIFVLFAIGGGIWWYANKAIAEDHKKVSRKGSSKKKSSSKKSKDKDSSKKSKKEGSSKKKSSSKKSRK